MLDRLREHYQRWRVTRRRQKLLAAYTKIGRAQHGLGPGLSPTLYAYDRVLDEGLATIERADDEEKAVLVWHWPEGMS